VIFPARSSDCAAKLLTCDEARRFVANIVKLPELLKRPHYKFHRPVWFDSRTRISLNVFARRWTSRGKLSPGRSGNWLGLFIG
jgi:hypothetical protein